jgi:NHL repeat-containing protein
VRRHAKAFFAVAALTLLATLGSVAPALALQTHAEGENVDGSGTPLGGLQAPAGLAIDPTSSELYVFDYFGAGSPVEFTGAAHIFDATVEPATFLSQLTGENTPGGLINFAEPADVAVDASGSASDGNVYVTDAAVAAVDAFDPASPNHLLASFGDTEGGTDGQLHGHAPAIGGFSSPCGLAVDQSNGDLYVADQGKNKVFIFDSTGAYKGKVADSTLSAPCGLALDSTGNLYVRNAFCFCGLNEGKVLRFNRVGPAEYDFASVLYSPDNGTPENFEDDKPPATDVAVNTSDDHAFVDLADRILEYDSGGSLVTTFGQGVLCCSTGIAVDPASGKVYASQFNEVHSYGPLLTLPDATTGDATDITDEEATLKGTVDPAGGPDAECEFEYGTNTGYGQSAPCAPVGPYSSTQEVTAALTGLDPATTYHYRLHATSAEGDSFGADRTFTTDGPPVITGLSVSGVDSSAATLKAQVNPSGPTTTYRFEYTTKVDFEANGFANATKSPVPDASAGAGNTAQPISRAIEGLQPDTAYEFRVVATNAIDTTTSAAKSFKTFEAPEVGELDPCPNAARRAETGSQMLSGCRAWEMVSPPDKKGADIMAESTRTRAATDGSAVSFSSLGAFADAVGIATAADYIAERSSSPNAGDTGWVTHAITPPVPGVPFILVTFESRYDLDFSDDLSTGIVPSLGPLTDDPFTTQVPNLYRRTDLRSPGSGHYELLTGCPLCEEAPQTPLPPMTLKTQGFLRPVPVLASADLETVAFETGQRLTKDVPVGDGPTHLYESDHGTVRHVGRIPDSPAEASCDDTTGTACVPISYSMGGSGLNSGTSRLRGNAVSDQSDGHNRVFFTQPTGFSGAPADGGESGNVFMRVDGHETAKLNFSERSTPSGFSRAKFSGASADGSRVFFSSEQLLTDNAPGGSTLYMYDASKPATAPDNLTVINLDHESADLPRSPFKGLVGVGGQGHYVYFVATGQLIEGGPPHPFEDVLYLWHDGSLTEIGHVDFDGELSLTAQNQLTPHQARVTPDGKHLLFGATRGRGLLSVRGGSDYDHGTTCTNPNDASIVGCRQLYVYAAETDSLKCASCDPSGSPATTTATIPVNKGKGGSASASRDSQAFSGDGRYAFFSTAERLVGADRNSVSDAYVYDAVREKPYLLSSGEDKSPSYFVEATPDGSNAFFVTRERLSRWDVDDNADLYDARVGGGFSEPPTPPPSCIGDACQPTPSGLNDPGPASSSFRGPVDSATGKPRPSRCVKGRHRVRSRSGKTRCVKRDHKGRHVNHKRRAGR